MANIWDTERVRGHKSLLLQFDLKVNKTEGTCLYPPHYDIIKKAAGTSLYPHNYDNFKKIYFTYLYTVHYDIIIKTAGTCLYLLHYDIIKKHLVYVCTLFTIMLWKRQ